MSIAELGLAIDSSPAKRAAVDLDALTQSAGRVESATKRASAAASQNATATGALAAQVQAATTANDNATSAVTRHIAAIERLTAAESRMGSSSYSSRAADIAAYGTALDGLRAKFNPVFAAIQQYKAAQSEIRQANAVGAISVNEMTAAIDRERSATLRAIEAAKGLRNAQSGAGGVSAGARRAAGFSAGQQVQDVAVMAAMGMPISSIAFGQGPQLATAFQQGGGFGAIKEGLMSLISPTTLITVGLTAAAAAAIKFGMSLGGANPEAEKFHDWLSKIGTDANTTADFLAKVNAEIAKMPSNIQVTRFARGGLAFLDQQKRELDNPLAQAAGYEGNLNDPKFVETYNLIDKVIGQLRNEDFGTVEDLYNKLDEIVGLRPDLQKFAETWLTLGENIIKTREALDRADLRAHGMGAYQPRNGQAMSDWMAGNSSSLYQMQQQRNVDLLRLNARSPQEHADAARAAARLEAVPGEGAEVSRQREENAAALAYAQAMKQITDAQDARKRSLDATLASQQLDISLIGKTAGEVASAQFAFQQLQQIREEAARAGITSETEFQKVFGKEIDLIEKATAKIKEYADEAARAKLATDLAFERDQLGRSTVDQQIAARLRSAGLPVDLNGQFAQQMRDNQHYSDARNTASGFVKTFGQELVNSGGDIGKSLGKAIESALLDATSKAWERLADQLGIAFANWLTGSSGASAGGGTGAFGTASGFADLLFGKGAANDNYAPGAVTRAPLPAIGSGSSYSVDGATDFIKQYSAAIGIDPDIALRVAKSEGLGNGIWQSNAYSNGIREPSYGPFQLLKGGKGTGFGTGLGNKFMAQTGLDPADPANWQQSTAFALDQAKASGWGAWYGAKGQGITGFMGIDQSASKAVGALDKLATSSVDTATSLSSGLGKLGSSLSQFPAAPAASGGGGGLFSWLGGLFGGGGLSSAFSGSSAFSWLSANPGGYIGLYADGTENAPPGWAWVGERGPELKKLRAGDVIRSNPRSMQMVAENSNGGGMPAFSPVFNVDARGSTMSRGEFEQIARQQSEAALASYHKNQVRGGFGSTQKRYASQKG